MPQVYRFIPEKSWLVVLILFGLLACLMIPLYFYARTPRRGTIEWIGRLDPVHFRQPRRHPFHGADAAWALLSGLCAAFIRFAFYLFFLSIPGRDNALALLREMISSYYTDLAASALFAVALYLMLRAMFGRILPAMCIAILSGLLLTNSIPGSALLMVSLLLLYCWVAADCSASLFPRGLLFVLSADFYALALFPAPALLWLSPFYLAVYGAVLIVRWRKGSPERRKKDLILSLALVGLAFIGGTLAVWILYAFLRGWFAYSGLSLLFSKELYLYFFSFLGGALDNLSPGRFPLHQLSTPNVMVLILGGVATVPLLHGLFKLRDSRCLFLLALLVCTVGAALFAASFYLAVPLLLILGWTWNTYSKRGYPAYAALFAGLTALVGIIDIIIH